MNVCATGFVAAEWDRLRAERVKGNLPDEMLHTSIVEILVTSCFYCDDNIGFAREKLMGVMQRFHELVKDTDLKRNLKVVKEIAMRVGCSLGNR
jgi:hypothetical protein